MEEEVVLCRFGTPLEPLEEDEIPSKKPILVEDQIVTDENGRRRFHGAFTGGFSAGFWNTVGSLEGWTPKEFKSSRDEKTIIPQQKPSDFMDNEDFSEFGIAPQRLQTTEDFSDTKKTDTKKRKNIQNSSGPIPGVPILHQLLEPSKDNIALRLLKKMGWKEGQGIGARQTLNEKKMSSKQNFKEQLIIKKYGCDMGPIIKETAANSEESDLSDIEGVTFAPDDFEPHFCSPKDDCFGLGYTGLSRDPVLKEHVNLFGPLELLDKDKQKLSIRGKGFGVGAMEEEDEDIYHHDDLSNYDFSLEKPSDKKKKISKLQPQDFHVIEGFCISKESEVKLKKVFVLEIPSNFKPRNWLLRKSRFEPLDEKRAVLLKKQQEIKIKGLGRHDITVEERGAILEDETKETKNILKMGDEADNQGNKKKLTYLDKINEKYKARDCKKEKVLDMLASKSNMFVKSGVISEGQKIEQGDSCIFSDNIQKENEIIKNEINKITKNMESTTPAVFKPFLADLAKQERYEKYLCEKFTSDEEIASYLSSIQPSNMSEWDRQMEKKEFEQAKKIYKPLQGIMSDRFVTETAAEIENELKVIDPDRRGKTIRTKSTWNPESLLCKRFNISEPFSNLIKGENTIAKPKLSVFEYLEPSVNKKESFITPIIIPRTEEIQKLNVDLNSSPKRLSAKDMFAKEISSNNSSLLQGSELNEINTSSHGDIVEVNVKVFESENSKNQVCSSIKKGNSKYKPKNELEQKIEELKDKHPSEKKNLYKQIFEDSSDSEDDDHLNSINVRIELTSQNTQKEELENSKELFTMLNKPASEVNILRNNSPPRGIFAAFFKDNTLESKSFTIQNKPNLEVEKNNDKTSQLDSKQNQIELKRDVEDKFRKSGDENSLDVYGPKLLVKTVSTNEFINDTGFQPNVDISQNDGGLDNRLQKLMKKSKNKTKIVEEWVELTNENIKERKSSRKDRKKKKKKNKSRHRSSSSSTSEKSSPSSDSSHRAKKKSKKKKKDKKYRK